MSRGEGYIASLEAIQQSFDSKLLPIRLNYQYHMNSNSRSWILTAMIKSLLDFKGFSGPKPEDVSAIKLLLSTAITTYLGWGTYAFVAWIFHLDWASISTWLIPLVWFVLKFNSVLNGMSKLGSTSFDIRVYRMKQKGEYEMFLPYLQMNEFSFQSLYQWIRDEIMIVSTRRGQEIADIRASFERNVEDLTHKITELSNYQTECEELQKEIHELNEVFDRLARHSKQTLSIYNYCISFIYRLRSEDCLFNPYDLRVISDFSLYQVMGNQLIRVYEQGNSTSPRVINLDDPKMQSWSAVRVVNNWTMMELSTWQKGRFVDSYRFDIGSRTYVYNFHFDSETENDLRDLIRTKQLNRLIKAILLHLNERGMLREAI
ncbi:hypothetical protein [Paenibacillus sp. Y412MC10]|uniref:hypothetical protein n=1 Tax=Geobacillus sp. (strain Y412MC10) TaxID=481743 RepID=UPI0011AB637F|nr:hypothetical protein [Paenibacillus sp. Y412MC10]